MPIYIYNSLTRKKEEFIPLNPPRVNIYTCGVTVYDESHIGHARSLYIFDVIRNYLAYRGFKVRFVRNITDIDDKIINRSKELKINWQQLVKRYIDRYYEDLETLGVLKGDYEPRATENIAAMLKHIKGLIKKGYAYVTDTGVYFSVRKFKEYGKLSGQSIDQMLSGARIETDETKQDPLDFALWKKSKEDEPSWESPWSGGRPGWHIECSVMSQKFLKTDTLDIHAGGRDLIFPHHENEIAQSEALTGKPFAKYWIHHGLLTINGQKMAKSLGNFVTIKDFIRKYNYGALLKLFFLSAHYSHPIDYTEEKIEEAKQRLDRILILLGKIVTSHKSQVTSRRIQELEDIKNKFTSAMDDDFNTPKALGSIFELINLANKNIGNLDFTYTVKCLLDELLDILGIREISVTIFPDTLTLSSSLNKPVIVTEKVTVKEKVKIEIVDEDIKAKIKEREKAKQEKNYPLADKIRKELLEEMGIILEDTKSGTVWRRKL